MPPLSLDVSMPINESRLVLGAAFMMVASILIERSMGSVVLEAAMFSAVILYAHACKDIKAWIALPILAVLSNISLNYSIGLWALLLGEVVGLAVLSTIGALAFAALIHWIIAPAYFSKIVYPVVALCGLAFAPFTVTLISIEWQFRTHKLLWFLIFTIALLWAHRHWHANKALQRAGHE